MRSVYDHLAGLIQLNDTYSGSMSRQGTEFHVAQKTRQYLFKYMSETSILARGLVATCKTINKVLSSEKCDLPTWVSYRVICLYRAKIEPSGRDQPALG